MHGAFFYCEVISRRWPYINRNFRFTPLARVINHSPMLADDLVHDREPQTCSVQPVLRPVRRADIRRLSVDPALKSVGYFAV